MVTIPFMHIMHYKDLFSYLPGCEPTFNSSAVGACWLRWQQSTLTPLVQVRLAIIVVSLSLIPSHLSTGVI